MGGVLLAATTLWRMIRAGRPTPLAKADAILVFGAALWLQTPSHTLARRTERAARLYAEGWAPTILCSGGLSSGKSEAFVMRALLLGQGVPADAVIPDDGGVSTREAIRSARRFGQGAWRLVIAVSSSYHMYRIGREARRQGLKIIPCPALRLELREWRQFVFFGRQYLRELTASAAYAATGHLERLWRGRWGRKTCWALHQVTARLKSLLGEADAVAAASEAISYMIKKRVVGFSDTNTVLTPAAGLSRPVEGVLGDRFGLRHNRLHAGVDFKAAYGSPVVAAAAGQILFARRLGPYGNLVVIHHGGGLATVYAHLAGFVVADHEGIAEGQLIGFLGMTGRSYGPHLHFEVRVHGSPVEPLVYLAKQDDCAPPRSA